LLYVRAVILKHIIFSIISAENDMQDDQRCVILRVTRCPSIPHKSERRSNEK